MEFNGAVFEFELDAKKSPKANRFFKKKNKQALSLFCIHNEQHFVWMQPSSACPSFSSPLPVV